MTQKPKIAHHGMQRSGTNYVRALLEGLDYFVLNGVDPRRDSPRHKHFRWQADKSTIVMDRSYCNDVVAQSLVDLNLIAGWDRTTQHVVVFKYPEHWVRSILRWGRSHGWTDCDSWESCAPIVREWLREWDAYHLEWERMRTTSPDQVHFICYEALDAEPGSVMTDLQLKLGRGAPLELGAGGRVARVAHSRQASTNPSHDSAVCKRPLQDLCDAAVTWNWRQYLELQ